jgi:hypothetical protein
MKCDEARNKILLADSGELSPRAGQVLEAHLAICSECRGYRQQLQAVLPLARQALLPEGEPAPRALASILRAGEARLSTPRLILPFPVTFMRALALVAAVVLVVTGMYAWVAGLTSRGHQGTQDLGSLLAMVAGESDSAVSGAGGVNPGNREEHLRQLGRQLLEMEGLSAEAFGDPFLASPETEHPPTSLQPASGQCPVAGTVPG